MLLRPKKTFVTTLEAVFVPLNRPLIFHDIEGLGFPFATHLILAFLFSKMLRSVVVSTSEIIGGDITRRYDIWRKKIL